MNKSMISMLIACCLSASIAAPSISHAFTAVEIMKKYTDLFNVTDETEQVTMTLVNMQGKKKVRSLTIMTKDFGNDLSKMLIRFTAPENINGAALLISENERRSDDQWLYLPALKKVKKIAAGDRSQSFMGSEFAYEDLYPEVASDYNYTLVRSEACGGYECYVIEAVPASPRKIAETGYSKRIVWVREDIFFKIKTEFYDKKGTLLKTETDEDLTQIAAGKYRMNKIIMLNNSTGDSTNLESKSREIDKGIPASKFTTTYLEQGSI